MSEKNQIVVVLIVALFLGALIDRRTALKIVAGVVLPSALARNNPGLLAKSDPLPDRGTRK